MTTALNQLSMEKMFDLLNTKDRTISILDEKVSSLEVEVGKSKEYYSIKKVAIINSKKEKDYKWSLLKKESVVLGKEIKTERDNNYGNVNSYHIDVWKKVYPTENYS
jgi:serine kinase of HPr protein (carbohydrate metabolism regulator)